MFSVIFFFSFLGLLSLITPSFGNYLFAYHFVLKHLQQNMILSSFRIPKILICATFFFKDWLTNKYFTTKIILTRAFSIVKIVSKGSLYFFLIFHFECYESTPNHKICLTEVQRLEQSPNICYNFDLKTFG